MTHPFHPLLGREFVFLAMRQTWSEDRVFVLDENGRQCSFPVGWTDAVEPDVFVSFAAGRSPFRVDDLLDLARLIDGLMCPGTDRCKANYAITVRCITHLPDIAGDDSAWDLLSRALFAVRCLT